MSDVYYCDIETENLRFCEKALSDEELATRYVQFSSRCAACGREITPKEIGYVHPVTLEDVCKDCWEML